MSKADRTGDELTEQHNRGEQDGAEGKYDPPDITPSIFHPVSTERQLDNEWADKEAYDKGYENARKQK
jgi:hypothetical protein